MTTSPTRRHHACPALHYGQDPHATGETTVGRSTLSTPSLSGTRHGTSLSQRRRSTRRVEVVTAVIVTSHPLLCGIVGTATRSRGRHFKFVSVRVLRHDKKAHGTGTVPMTTTTEGMTHGVVTGIADVDGGFESLDLSP